MQEEQISLGISEEPAFSAPTVKETLAPYEPSPNDPPWNIPVAFLTWAMSVVSLLFFGSVPVALYALSQNIGREEFGAFIESPRVILIAICGTIPAHIVTLIFCWFVVTRKGEFSISKTLGMKWGGFHFGYCLLSVVVFYAIFGTLLYYVGNEDTQLTKVLNSSREVAYVIAFLAVFTAPIVEEVVHRGVLYSALQRSLSAPAAIIITSFVFAAIHFPQYYESAVALTLICALSLGLTLIRWKSKNLLPCIVTHLIFNGIQAGLLIAEPYLPKEPPPPVSAFFHLVM
jgi:membrane protease YdiL (CAAX protease family)